MNERIKTIAITISGAALALAMGIQTFVFGKNDLQSIKEELTAISTRVSAIEARSDR